MKKSPFMQLLDEIEREIFDLSLDVQLRAHTEERVDSSFVLGYRAALNTLYAKALAIYRRKFPALLMLSLDERTEEASEMIEEEWRKKRR